MHHGSRGSFRLQYMRLLGYSIFLPITILLAGCLVTPYGIIAPPLPVVHTEQSLELYVIEGPMPAGESLQAGHAYLCSTFVDKRSELDEIFREGGHAKACDGDEERRYDFTHEKGRWAFADGSKRDRFDSSSTASTALHYAICTKSGSRVESLNTTANSTFPRVKMKDMGCEEYIPPLERALDLYYVDAPLAAGLNAQTVPAHLCGSRSEKRSFDFGFRQGGHGYTCGGDKNPAGYYEFTLNKGRWVLQSGMKASLPEPVADTASSSGIALRRYVMCKRVGSRPEALKALTPTSSSSVQRRSGECSEYFPPSLESES